MENSPHRLEYRIIYGDTDAGGIVYNGNYLRFLEMGRTEMMRERICSYKDVEKRGLILPVTESYLRYKAPAFYDDLITIETKLVELKKVSCKFTYKIIRKEEGSDKERLLTRGYTVHAAVNLQGKLTPFPEDLVASLQTMIFQKTQ